MLPIVGMLLAQGFGLIANAVKTKGQEVIEEKLGVKLDDVLGTDEGRFKLKQLELNHEEFLTNAAIENKKIDLDYARLDLDNTKDARAQNVAIQTSAEASYIAKVFPYILDGIIVCATLIMAILLFWCKIPADNKEIMYTSFGSLFTMSMTILNFHRGTSRSSQSKDDTINKMAGAQA